MQRKLGLLADLDLEEQDQELVEGLLKTMHETGETVGCLLSNSMHNRLCSSWNLWPHDSQAAVRTVTPPCVPANMQAVSLTRCWRRGRLHQHLQTAGRGAHASSKHQW